LKLKSLKIFSEIMVRQNFEILQIFFAIFATVKVLCKKIAKKILKIFRNGPSFRRKFCGFLISNKYIHGIFMVHEVLNAFFTRLNNTAFGVVPKF